MAQLRTNHIAEQYEFAGTGEIYSYTAVQDAPEGYEEQAPYFLALVKLDEGQIVTAQLTDVAGQVAIGDRVEMVTRKLTSEGSKGMIVYGYKFRPVLSA
jgi:uncharacterized OB-fold protein